MEAISRLPGPCLAFDPRNNVFWCKSGTLSSACTKNEPDNNMLNHALTPLMR